MKKIVFILFLLCINMIVNAQVLKTLSCTAGQLSTALSSEEKNSITSLTLTGTIDARDFKTMRDAMPLLAQIDLSAATIAAYSGAEGTINGTGNYSYSANEVPQHAFINRNSTADTSSLYVLSSVILPESATSIRQQAFYNCKNLSSITLPSSLINILDNAFSYCNKLTSIIIPNKATSIGWGTFYNCKNLTSIILPNSLTEISNNAFGYCSKLKDINIPASVTAIKENAFRNCAGPFIVAGGNLKFSSLNGVLFDKNQITLIKCPNSLSGEYNTIPSTVKNIENYAFYDCDNLTSVVIPEGIISIGNYSFYSCSKLASTTLPSTVRTIGNYAFNSCNLITSIYANSSTPVDLSGINSVFYGISKTNCTLYVPHGLINLYRNALQWKDFQNIVEMQGLFPSTTTLSFNPSATSKKIFIASNVSWSASSSVNWLSTVPPSSAWSDSLIISVTENTGSVRTGTITINATGMSSKTVTVTQYGVIQVTAGNLAAVLGNQLTIITNLTLSGTIDARDFKTMRDDMPILSDIDLSGVTITAYNGSEGTLTSNSDYPANIVPHQAFMNSNWQGKRSLASVILPPSVTEIGRQSFYDCTNLSNITLPSTLEIINDESFYNCNKITSAVIPNGVYYLGWRVFAGCDKLMTVSLPESLTGIQDDAFSDCTKLKDINIPASVNIIGSNAFSNCAGPFNVDDGNLYYSSRDGVLFDKDYTALLQCPNSLTGEYPIPPTVSIIGTSAFYNCDYLVSIIIPKGVISIESNAFYSCDNLSSVIIPEGVLYIGDQSFSDCLNLKSITIPSTVEIIGNRAFAYSYLLESVYANPVSPVDLSNSYSVFDGLILTNCVLYVPSGSKLAYQNAAIWQNFQNIIEVASTAVNVTAGKLATLLGDQLETITSLTLTGNIDARDFKTMRDSMPFLAEIDLSGVTIVAYNGTEGTINSTGNYSYYANEIPQQAFFNTTYWEGKTTLTTVTLPQIVTSIRNEAFSDCINLTNITLPSSLRFIYDYVFRSCNKLTSVNIPLGVISIGLGAFSECNNLISVILPNSLTEIRYDAFGYCRKLKDINIPSSVNIIRERAFQGCAGPFIVDESNKNYSSLEGVLFDKNQYSLLQYPNSQTGEYTVPPSVITIGDYAFGYCNLTKVNIPESVISIGDDSFFNCSNLTSITIPSTVMAIGNYAFAYSWNLTSITTNSPYPVDLSNSSSVFIGIDKTNCTLYVPYGSKAAYQNAIKWQDFENIVEMQGLFPSTTSLSFNIPVSSKSIFIASSVGWSAESSADWLSLNPSSSVRSDSLLVSVTQNSGDVRTATITIHPTGLNDLTITVTQYGVVQVTAGNLATVLGDQLGTTTSLTLVGTIDARDFKTMRDAMPSLAEIDLSGVTIIAYSGAEGTYNGTGNYFYPANEVPQQAFINNNGEGKTSLVSVVFPPTVTSIGSQAFYYCPNLSNIILPSSLSIINNNAFASCRKLKDINIPASVTVIKDYAFIVCAGPFIVDASNPNYSSLNGVLFDKNQITLLQYPISKTGVYTTPSSVKTIGIYAFYNCDSIKTINISEGVTSINNNAFYDCSNLTSITIPATVSNIGSYAFAYSNLMASIYSNSSAPVDLTPINGVFNGINKTNCTLFVPYGSKAAYQNAVQWKDFTNIVEATSGFGVGVKTVLLPSIKSDTTINVIANVPWNVSSDQAWLSVSPLSGTNNGAFIISATANKGYKRKATVTLSSTGYDNQVLYITQGSGLPYFILSDSMNISTPLVCDNYLQVITNNYNQFFRFIPEQGGNYTFYSESSSNPVAAVLNSSKNYLGGDDDSWTDRNFIFTCNLNAGEEYYFRLRNYSGNNQVIDLYITGGKLVCNQDGIPEDQQISSETLSENVDTCFNAYENITVAGDGTSVIFESGSSTRIIAGNSIRFLPGFYAQSGSWMDAHITTDSSFCDRPSASIVSLPAEKSVSDDFINQDNINPIITKSAKVYPNPNNGNFNIEFSNLQIGSDIHIYNMQGRLVHKETIQNTNLQQINIMGQKQGVYVLKIRDGKETINQKLIIY